MTLRRIRDYFAYSLGLSRHLFIHIPKNAGVAIRKCPELQWRMVSAEPAFHKSRQYTRELYRVMQANGEHHGFQHARVIDIHPRVRERLQPVAVIRNPWARVASRFHFAQLAMQQHPEIMQKYAANSFEEFLEERHVYGGQEFYWHRAIRGWFPQHDYVVDETGRICVHLLRQEFLSQEAQAYFQFKSPLQRRNVSANSKQRYQELYSPKTIQIVADWYARDIETFGFDFDSSATRNVYFSGDAAKRAA